MTFEVLDRLVRAVNFGNGVQKTINFPPVIERALFAETDLKKVQYIILSDNKTSKKIVVICGLDDFKSIIQIINRGD